MKPMIWHPEPHDEKVNAYLEKVNHAPYEIIFAAILGFICLSIVVVLIGVF